MEQQELLPAAKENELTSSAPEGPQQPKLIPVTVKPSVDEEAAHLDKILGKVEEKKKEEEKVAIKKNLALLKKKENNNKVDEAR